MPSQRAVLAAFLALAVFVVVWVSLFVWPGSYSSLSCGITGAPTGAPTTSVQGRTYCEEIVPLPHYFVNYTFGGFKFALDALPNPGGPGCGVVITEPNGTSFSGGVGYVGPTPPPSSYWFTPDDRAGIGMIFEPPAAANNVTLLVSS